MIPRATDAIDAGDLAALVANRVAERRDLEFKRELLDGSDRSKKEFLADVTSFANALGGDLLFGIAERNGTAAELSGLAIDNPDAELRRLEQIVVSGVEPRISGLSLRWIPIDDARGAILIRIPPSAAAPHRVVFANSGKFYSRKSNGKYEMDTHELRLAFTASEALPARLRELHRQAVVGASGVDMPIELGSDPKAIVSVLPLSLFRETRDLHVTPETALAPVKPSGRIDSIHTLEGVLIHSLPSEEGAVRSYALTHRQGRTDVVWTIGRVVDELRKGERRIVWPKRFEDGLLDAAISSAAKLQPFGIEGPWIVFVTVTGIKDYRMAVNAEYGSDAAWRDQATLPELVVERLNRAALLPLLRSFWLLFGEVRPDEPSSER